ncbi:MAG: hypothetical protein P4L67_04560 [Candidatus Pacebacteria bacterium]|nr:hypothetical protein [Candidatus Paceibacterota bacterium]
MQPLTKYLVKEFEPGDSQDFKIHLVDDYAESSESTIWHWIKRAARSGLEIYVEFVESPILRMPGQHPYKEYLVIDNREGKRAKSLVWVDDLEPWIDLANSEDVAIHPLTCVLDLS